MLRIPRNIINGTNLKVVQRSVQQQQLRHQSQQAGRKSAGGGIAIGAGAVTIVGLGGVLGYAAWSDENRQVIDSNVPGAQLITDALLGAVPTIAKPKPPLLVAPPPPSFSRPPIPQKQLSQVAPKQEENAKLVNKSVKKEKMKPEKDDTKASVAPTSPVAPAPPVAPAITAGATLSAALLMVMKDTNSSVTKALDAAERAAEVVQTAAIDAVKLAEKGGLTDASKSAVSAAITAAEQAFKLAQRGVTDLATEIACSRSSGSSEDTLAPAEQAIADLAPAVVKVKSVITNSLNTMLNVDLLCRTVTEARNKLVSEVHEVLPSISKEEVMKQPQLVLSHAHNRIAGLEKLITEKHKALEELRARGPAFSEDGSGASAGVTEGTLQAELDKLRHQLTLQHRSDLGRQQEELEAEVRGQLKRQAAAHNEHLSDELVKQEHDLSDSWQLKLYDQINREKDGHFRELAAIRGKLLGLQSAVTARADADRAAHAARQLWLACQTLRNAVRLGKEGASSWDDQVQPLVGHLTAISVAAGSDEFVHGVVGSINKTAAERGVYTEEGLRHRFHRVATVARRVAMVPENGGSLMRYLLSYVQSILLVQASTVSVDTDALDQPIDVHSLTTFDIIDKARSCLAADDLLSGVRWINQLTGESRRVAQDWGSEARLTLELQQACDALMAHAAATTATAL